VGGGKEAWEFPGDEDLTTLSKGELRDSASAYLWSGPNVEEKGELSLAADATRSGEDTKREQFDEGGKRISIQTRE